MKKRWKWGIWISLAFLTIGFAGKIITSGWSSPRRIPLPRTTKALIGSIRVIPKVSPGDSHIVVLAPDGSLWGQGEWLQGQLGDRNDPDLGQEWVVKADRITQLSRIDTEAVWMDVAVGGQQTFGVRADGTLWHWGVRLPAQVSQRSGIPDQIGDSTNWVTVSTMGWCMLGKQRDGTLWTWGYNLDGQMGDGTVAFRDLPGLLNGDHDWAEGVLGVHISVAVKSNGTLWAWGRLSQTNQVSRTPFQCGIETSWVRARSGRVGVFAERRDGSLWRLDRADVASGRNWTRLPDFPGGLLSWTAADSTLIAVNRHGEVFVSGTNYDGLLARRYTASTREWLPVKIDGPVVAVGMSWAGAGVVTERGDLMLWGRRFDDRGEWRGHLLSWGTDALSRIVPVLRPTPTELKMAYEVTPWPAMKFVRTNSIGW